MANNIAVNCTQASEAEITPYGKVCLADLNIGIIVWECMHF